MLGEGIASYGRCFFRSKIHQLTKFDIEYNSQKSEVKKMSKIKKGDIVARKSYGKDIIFVVKNIIQTKKEKIAILKGMVDRIEADSHIDDLEIVNKQIVNEKLETLHHKMNHKIIQTKENRGESEYKIGILTPSYRNKERIITGKILHLDGDKKYSQKSYYYYKKLGLNAVVRNIPEYRQPRVVYSLLKVYRPDILVITGHDGMIKRGTDYHNIYNYRNSKYFIQTVKEARRYDQERDTHLVIFAGACQSYFEAIISAGANFASSPARILIDFLDPLVIAEKVAFTEKCKYITIDDIAKELRDGKNGVSGIGANGKMILE